MLTSQKMRKIAPELDPLRLGTGWKPEDLSKPQIFIESTFGDSHPGSGHLDKLVEAARELDAYFQGRRRTFAVPLAPAGTPFQQRVWAELREIPFGATASYGEIAARIGNPRACRAVGMANHRNPIAILIPCHRVVGRSGSLVGYAGGLDIKRALLELEGAAQRRAAP